MIDKLPIEVIRQMYGYGNTYKIKFDKILNQLSAHIYIYRCSECFKEWNKWFAAAKFAEPVLDFAITFFYDQGSVYEDDLNDIIQLGF